MGADIVSGGELARALRAGIPASEVVFSGVGKTPEEIRAAIRAGVGMLNIESASEVELIGEIARELNAVARIGIRVNPDVTTDTHPYTQTGEKGMKFGVPLDDVRAVACRAAETVGLRLQSVGMHLGSQIKDPRPYREGAEKLIALVGELRADGINTLQSIDVGGGLGIAYHDASGERALDLEGYRDAIAPLARATGLPILLEPGRYLVANAGVLLTRVLYRKRSGGREIVVVDAGMNDLLRPSLYGAVHHMWMVTTIGATPPVLRVVDVAGPICESADYLGRERDLPGAVPGALVAIGGTGAYGFSMSSQYNARPRAAEVLTDGGRYAVARQRETLDDLMRGESVEPEWSV